MQVSTRPLAACAALVLAAQPALAVPRGSAPPFSFNTDNSLPLLEGGRHAASGVVNALSFAGGVAIGDGATHTVGNAPVGSIFHGKTTLAQLAAITINGTRPFFFLTDNGAITGPMCTYGTTINCFTSATGAYKLTDAKVPSLDVAWLALQAALLTRKAYVPANSYLVGTSLPLSLMIPQNQEGNINAPFVTADYVTGDGPGQTQIIAGSSFGRLSDGLTNIPLVSCGDPGATPTNALGRWAGPNGMCRGVAQRFSLFGSPAANSLTTTYFTDGLAHGARLDLSYIESHDFYRDITLTGDHTSFFEVKAEGGLHGVYWTPPNNALSGDFVFYDLNSSGQTLDSVEVDGAASMAGFFKGETYLNAGGYAINGDGNGCQPVMSTAYIDNLMTEYLGLGAINDAHNYSGGTYTDANKCRSLVNVNTRHWFAIYGNSPLAASGGLRRRATIDVASVSGHIAGLDSNGGEFNPVADAIGAAGIGIFNIKAYGDNQLRGFDVEGDLVNIFSAGVGKGIGGATIPFINLTGGFGGSIPTSLPTWSIPGGGRSGAFYALRAQGTYTSTVLGDVMEHAIDTFFGVAPGGYVAAAPFAGIVAQAGLTNGQVVPLQTRGAVYASEKFFNVGSYYLKKSVGRLGPVSVTAAGSGGTPGTYTLIGTGGGCATEPTVNVTVGAGGTITAASVTNGTSIAGCTSPPALSTSGVTGLSGGRLSIQWPSASGEGATSFAPTDVPIGTLSPFGSGNSGNGTQSYLTALRPVL